MKRWMRVLLVLSLLLLVGCASTHITSQINAEATGRSFNKVLVHGNFQNLEYQHIVEDRLYKELVRITDSECVKSYEVFFPGEEYSPEQVVTRLLDLKVDGILTLQPTGSGTTTSYIPQSSSTSVTGNTVSVNTRGGYNIIKPWANYEITLVSTSDYTIVWYATARSGGNAFANWRNLINSASKKTVRKLITDGVFHKLNKE